MKRAALFIADIIILYGALFITLIIRYPGNFAHAVALHLLPFSLIFIFWLIVMYIHGLYDPSSLRNTTNFFSTQLRSIFIAAAISIAFFYLSPWFGIAPRTNLFLFTVIFTLFAVAQRSIFNRVIERRFHKRTVIVGTNQNAVELANFLKENPQLGYDFREIIDSTMSAAAIESAINNHKAGVIILSPEAYRVQEIIDLFYKSLGQNTNFYNLASFYEKVTGRVPLGAINQIWFLENISEGSRRSYEAIKRVLDIIGAFLLGLPTLVLTPLIALVVRFDSPGPIFYTQQRVGQRGKTFEMIKFRTMIANDARGGAEGQTGPVWASENDPRITRLGSFLRKSRINELPQIWNILKGEMSFIGPRAERPEFHEKLTQEIPFYEERYLVKPGATGWAQLQKSYYASVIETHEKLQYDLYYIKNRSLVLDLGILLKTINVILRGGGR